MNRARIEGLETLAVTLPTRPFQTTRRVRAGLGPLTSLDFVFVLIHAGDGLVGLGECVPMLGFSNTDTEGAIAALERHIAPKIVGFTPFDMERIGVIVDHIMPAGGTVKAGIDLALHDLAGKILGVPVHALIGGKLRDRVPVCAEVSTSDADRTAEQAMVQTALGFNSLKLKVGGEPTGDAACFLTVREAVGLDVEIRVDANQGWTLKEAMVFERLTRERRLNLMEQPLPRFDLAGMAILVRSLPVPIEVDEALVSMEDAHRVAAARAADLLNIKLGKNGGIANCRSIAKFAHGLSMPVVVGTDFSLGVAAAAKLHLAATLPNLHGAVEFSELGLFEFDVGATLLSRRSFHILHHCLEVPDEPGLGVELDRAMMRQFAFHARR